MPRQLQEFFLLHFFTSLLRRFLQSTLHSAACAIAMDSLSNFVRHLQHSHFFGLISAAPSPHPHTPPLSIPSPQSSVRTNPHHTPSLFPPLRTSMRYYTTPPNYLRLLRLSNSFLSPIPSLLRHSDRKLDR